MTLPELMTLFVRDLRGWKDVKLPPRWAENLLDRGRALILLDGFDEVAAEHRGAMGALSNGDLSKDEENPRTLAGG